MRILITIVHHWNPQGNGNHASLRPNPEPRLHALQDQLLSFRRLDLRQGALNIHTKTVENANQSLRHKLSVRLVTDGQHHLAERLDPLYQNWVEHVPTSPEDPRHLGFEAQRLLAEGLDEHYDLYAYFEDDLLIHDPFFFHKIAWFQAHIGEDAVLLPQRMELFWKADTNVDKFYIDGPIPRDYLEPFLKHTSIPVGAPLPGGDIVFIPPVNPHAGCFVLTHAQMQHWSEQDWFLDGDCSFISPLESAATLGLCKTFRLFKPHLANAAFLELQHWGTSFRSLIGGVVSSPGADPGAANGADAADDCD